MNPSTNQDQWQSARLIPTSGISGAEEQERRATSALLAVMAAVHEFGAALTKPLGAGAGKVAGFIEVPFRLGDRKVIPDGLIRVERGKHQWTALLEVKTGANRLDRAQVESYLDVARDQQYDAVVTISNQIAASPTAPVLDVDKRKLRTVELHHLSWARVLTEAIMQMEHRGVADPDQAWILGELIAYLEHPRSGALEFGDMGENWVAVRNAARDQSLRSGDKAAADVAVHWDQLLRFLALRLGRELGAPIEPVQSRKEAADPSLRVSSLVAKLADEGRLTGAIRIPDAVGPVEICADLRASRIFVSVDIDAPKSGRPKTRVSWVLRQLREASSSTRVDAFVARSRTSMSESLERAREDPMLLVEDPKKEPRSFRVTGVYPMGAKRNGRGVKAFIGSVLLAFDDFYATVVQDLRPWRAPAPKMKREPQGDTSEQTSGADQTHSFLPSRSEH